MAIQYYMRAFNTTLVRYVDWVVNDTPDSTGAFSGFPTNQLINITVNRVVQSKVSNFLKPNQSLGGTDGEFFHVNSYDWKNAVSPIPPPTVLTGFAVERGVTAVTSVSTSSNTSPIVVTSSSNHGLASGQLVTINGVTGNTNTNGTWPIIVISPTTFSLTGSTGNAAYVSGGSIFTPSDFATLIWDEVNNVWRFVFNTKGDGTTLGASQSVKVNNFFIDGYLALGTNPASQGIIRLPNNQYIFGRDSQNLNDIQIIGVDTFVTPTGENRIKIGALTTDVVYTPGIIDVDGYVQHDGSLGNVATIGFIREKNNTTIVAFRTQNGLLDIAALSSNATNNIIVGDSVNSGILYNTSNTNVHQFQVNTTPVFEIGTSFARFPANVASPFINQTVATAGSGQTLTLQAQQGAPGATVGGILQLASGSFGTGGAVSGSVDIYTGTVGAGTLKMRVFPTVAAAGTDNNSIIYFENLFRVDAAQTNPIFRQDTSNSLTTGNVYTVQAQNTSTASSVGGILALTSGTGTTNAGQVQIQTGGVNQILVSPLTIAPGSQTATTGTVIIRGNLEVVGTTTTVDSTVVDIIGRIIHANWADPAVSPNVAVPSQVVGYSIHRGNSSSIPRDGAAIIWTEGALNSGADGYWRHVTYPGDGIGTDNFTIANSLNAVGTMANDFAASTDPNPVLGALAATGSFRSSNNVPAVVGRTNQASTTLTATGLTNGSATLPLGTITVVSTTGFSTPNGSLLIQSSAGTQTVTYTGTTGTSFTGATGGTGTIVTGGIVAQTNASTTIAAGSNNVALPTGTINVASTTGFPTSGTLRVVSRTSASATSPPSVQVIAYTGTGATTFTGCTGGTGTMFTGDAVTSTPIPGISDLPLVGTDFGNRVLHGFTPTSTGNVINNTGHIFNTPTGFIYDFQVNSVTQVQLASADVDVSGFAETIAIGPTVSNPRLIQTTLPNTGATNGFNLGVFAQAGQLQTGGNNNNNGGLLVLASGAQGTGGAGTAGIDGYVELRTGFTSKVRVFPTVALSAGDNNSILYFENLFRVDTAQTNPVFRQDSTGGASGQVYTIQAQNAATTGGNLVLTSGTGATAGNVQLQTGAVDRVVVHPTFTEFRDTAEALRITPVSAGTTQITYAATDTAAQINQTQTASTPSATMTIQSQVTTAASGVGGNLVLIGGNASGTTSTGGNVNLTSGSGTTTNGLVNVLIGGTQAIAFNNTDSDASGFSEVMTIASTIGTPRIFQASTGSASGTILALMAQNAATTGGPLQLHSGTGATNDGYINLTTGTTVKMTIFPTTAVSAANNNSVLLFENKFRFDTAQTTPLIRQDDKTANGGTGELFTVQAQNETGTTSTGGTLALTSGTGTTVAGNVNLQTGGVTRVSVNPTFTTFNDTSEAYRITPVSAGATTLQAINTATSVTYKQGDLTTASGTGATTTVQAQNETGTTSTGGALNLTSGTGTTTNGAVNLQAGGVTTASVVTNKFVLNKGWRRNVTPVTTTYQVLATDDYIAITTIAAPFTITLPLTPTTGDTYTFKDAGGNAATNNVTISGNGANIDGAATVVLTQNYSALVLTYTGTQWSIS